MKKEKPVILYFGIVLLAAVVLSCGLTFITFPYHKETTSYQERKAMRDKAVQKTESAVVQALQDMEPEKLKECFSLKVRNTCDDLDKGIDYLLGNFGNAEIKIVDSTYGTASYTRNKASVELLLVTCTFRIQKDTYTLAFTQYYENEKDPDLLGVYAMSISMGYSKATPIDIAGIYHPGREEITGSLIALRDISQRQTAIPAENAPYAESTWAGIFDPALIESLSEEQKYEIFSFLISHKYQTFSDTTPIRLMTTIDGTIVHMDLDEIEITGTLSLCYNDKAQITAVSLPPATQS